LLKIEDLDEINLNFTHRASFGDIGAGDKHGDMKKLADDTI
jgi:hypothetical protein